MLVYPILLCQKAYPGRLPSVSDAELEIRRVVDEEAVSVGGLGRVEVEAVAEDALQGARVRAQLALQLAVGSGVADALDLQGNKIV